MLDFDVARERLISEIQFNKKVVKKSIKECFGLVLASDIFAQYDTPLFDNSAMDGYALCDSSGEQISFTIVGRVAAGENGANSSLKEGEAVRIFTGAPLPKNTTTVVMQEYVTVQEDRLLLTKSCALRQNIRYQGEEIKQGELLLSAGDKLSPALVALCCTQGIAELCVYDELSIAILSTGNELIEPGLPLSSGKIYDANRYQLLAWLKKDFRVHDGGILPDSYEVTCSILSDLAQKHDVLILSGGASVGEEDHIKQAISSLGELTAWKLAIKPGKPFGWGKIGDCTIFMLPGNPVATYVTFYLLVYPLLLKTLGNSESKLELIAQANFTKGKKGDRREFLRGICHQDALGDYYVDIVAMQGSAMLSGLRHANCLVEIPIQTSVDLGDHLRVFPLI